MNKVIPFFEQHKLHAKKKLDFELWKGAVSLLHKNKGLKTNIKSTGNPTGTRKKAWDLGDLQQIFRIYKSAKQYKSKSRELKWLNEVS